MSGVSMTVTRTRMPLPSTGVSLLRLMFVFQRD